MTALLGYLNIEPFILVIQWIYGGVREHSTLIEGGIRVTALLGYTDLNSYRN